MTRQPSWGHGKSKDNRPKGEDAEKGVDWMDFDKPDGGPTRRMVNEGVKELPSAEEDEEKA